MDGGLCVREGLRKCYMPRSSVKTLELRSTMLHSLYMQSFFSIICKHFQVTCASLGNQNLVDNVLVCCTFRQFQAKNDSTTGACWYTLVSACTCVSVYIYTVAVLDWNFEPNIDGFCFGKLLI